MPDLNNTANVTLAFDGQRYSHWQKVSLRASVDDLCASLSLAVTIPESDTALPFSANTVVSVLIGEALVSTIRPDNVRRCVDDKSHTIQIAARSLGRELVDCQYSKTLNGLTLGDIVKKLCEAFAVPVTIAAETASVPNFSMQCEQPSNALLNAVRAANLLLYPLPDGGLILTAPTDAPPVCTLAYGSRIKSYEVVDEYKLRFSDYVVKSFDYDGNKALKGGVKDQGVGYFRPMHIVADRHGGSLGGCDRRAELERNRRLARAHRVELTISGADYFDDQGQLQRVSGWEYLDAEGKKQVFAINTQVRVVIPAEGIDAVFLIGECELSLDDRGGHICRLQLMSREAFLGKDQPKRKSKLKKEQS